MLRKWAYIPALLALCMPLIARDIFVTPGDSSSNTIGIYRADPLTSAGTITGPAGAFQVLRASATKFYVISRATVDTVTVYEGTIPALTQTKRFNLPQPAVAAAVSPDGRRVVVVAGDVSVFDTTTDTNLTTTGINVGSSPTSVAISLDSSRAFVLSPTTQRLTAIELTAGTAGITQTIPGIASQVAAAPNGFIYVTAPNSLLEFDPRTLTNTNTISLNAFPGSLGFTPDGRGAVLANTNPVTGSSLIHVDLVRRTFVVAPPVGGGAVLEDVVVTDNNTAYAYSPQNGRLYSVRLAPGSDAALTLTQIGFGSIAVEGVRDIAASNEVQARYLFITTLIGLFRLDSTGAVVGPINVPAVGSLSVNSAPTTTGASAITALNATQSIAAGRGSLPLVVRVADPQGNPVANVPISFAADLTGSTIVNAMAATNNLGLAVAYVNPPAGLTSGTIAVTATASGISVPASFTVNVGSGTPGGGTTAGGLQILSGNGQVLSQFQSTAAKDPAEPLTVIVRDAAGRPLPGVNITWTLTQGAGSVSPTISTTDDKGIATANFVSNLVISSVSYETEIVTASTGTETVSFYVTTLANFGGPTGPPGTLNAYIQGSTGATIEGRAGETIPAAFTYAVESPIGARLPFVGIRVETDQKVDGNNVASCRGGTQLSDSSGLAKCDLVLGNFIGETPITVIVGSARRDRFTIRITAGQPSSIRLVQGNNQSGNPGQQLPTALVAEVVDASGNLLAGVDVQWEAVNQGTVTLSQIVNRTDINGRASATATLGQTPGTAQVRVRAGTATATFNLTINLAASALTIVSGNNQTAIVNQAFTQPLTVRVLGAQSQPVAGAQVTFAVAQGSTGTVTFGSSTATTNAQGEASTTVTAGPTVGPVTVRVSVGTLSDNFTLTVRALGPGFTASSIVNAAGFQPGVSPGSIAFITASGIAPNLRGSVTPPAIVGPLPTRLSDVDVQINGIAAPIYAVSNVNGQESVIVQIPFEVAPGQASVTITVAGGGSTTVTGVQILPIKPGIFESADTSGRRYPVATRPDGSYVSPTNPARRGELIRVYATGLGQVTPATGTNRAGQPDQNVVAPIIVGVNNQGVRVVSSQLAPGSIGVYVVTFEVPADTQVGPAAPFAIAAVGSDGALVFSNGSAIPIQ